MNNNKKIAVTGATGMLGSCLVAQLLGRGYGNIVLPVRSNERLRATLQRAGIDPDEKALHPVQAELNDPFALKEIFEGVDTVFHCAAVVSLAGNKADELIETNVEITTHVVGAAVECGVRRLVHVSSIAALGEIPPGSDKKLIDETTDLESLAGTSPYGISKFYSENRAWSARAHGMEVVVVNPGVILGEGDWHSGGSTLIIPFAASGVPFYTDGAVGYVDVRDVARAMAMLAESEKAAGERFVLVGANLSYKDFFTRVARLAGKRPPVIRAGKILLGMAWRLAGIFSKNPSLTRAAARSAMRECLYDGSKVTRTLPDFAYTPIDETLARVFGAYIKAKRNG